MRPAPIRPTRIGPPVIARSPADWASLSLFRDGSPAAGASEGEASTLSPVAEGGYNPRVHRTHRRGRLDPRTGEGDRMTDYVAYFNGEFVPFSQVKIDPLDRGFLVGDCVFAVA